MVGGRFLRLRTGWRFPSVAAIVVTLGACAGPAASPAPRELPMVALVDSVPWSTDMEEGFHRRLEVRTGTRVDTIPCLVVNAGPPVVTPDGRVLGFAAEEGAVVSGFQWDPRRRSLSRVPLADDFHGYFSAPAISPDGRHVAYVVVPGDATAWAQVREWPRGRVVARGPTLDVPATDVAFNGARWIDADSFVVSIEITVDTVRFARVRGSVRTGVAAVDTVGLETEPVRAEDFVPVPSSPLPSPPKPRRRR